MTIRAKLPRLVHTRYGYHPDPEGAVTWWREAQAALDAANARTEALAKALRIMGIDPEKVLQERGNGNG
jgi:hypothetical protein